MKALLLVAHGSRRQASNDEVRALAKKLSRETGGDIADVRCAFLELAQPSIPDGIGECVDAGADEVIVLPYFLSAGRHVTEDIPAEIEKKQQQLGDRIRIHQLSYVGAMPDMIKLLLNAARE